MKIPKSFEMLVQNGLVDEVVYQLMSGKEAEVYVVQSKGELRCAKVYKDASQRSFSHQAQYQEGRKVRAPGRTRKWTRCSALPTQVCGCLRFTVT
jgi:RIO kinase 1